jgi:hypothetical protein
MKHSQEHIIFLDFLTNNKKKYTKTRTVTVNGSNRENKKKYEDTILKGNKKDTILRD